MQRACWPVLLSLNSPQPKGSMQITSSLQPETLPRKSVRTGPEIGLANEHRWLLVNANFVSGDKNNGR